jgi:hypothetical protein
MDADTERNIAKEVMRLIREQIEELAAMDAAGAVPGSTGNGLAFVLDLLAHLESEFGPTEQGTWTNATARVSRPVLLH